MDRLIITVERRADSGMWNAAYIDNGCEYTHCEETIEDLFASMGRVIETLATRTEHPRGRGAFVPCVMRDPQMLRPGERVALRSGRTVVVTRNERGVTEGLMEAEGMPVLFDRLALYPQVMVSAEGASWAREVQSSS